MNNSKYCISADNLSKFFYSKNGKVKKLFSEFSIKIKPGEIIGLTGPSGCGKTTLGDILLGLKKPDMGKVNWNGKPVDKLDKKSRAFMRPYFQKIYQDPPSSFPFHQTIKQALLDVANLISSNRTGSKGIREVIDQQICKVVQRVNLNKSLLNRYPGQLSGGEIQRFALSRALLLQPLFLVADEPTSRLDPSVQAQITRLLMEIAKECKMGILFISHDLELLKVACTKVISLSKSVSG